MRDVVGIPTSGTEADALIEIATVAASIDRRPNEEARTVYKAFTLGGQFTGKRDMFFLRARHFLLLHLPRFGGFLFASVPETRNPAFPIGCIYVMVRAVGLWASHFPRIHIAKCQMRFCPASYTAGLFYACVRVA
jgi:hypothetical protein